MSPDSRSRKSRDVVTRLEMRWEQWLGVGGAWAASYCRQRGLRHWKNIMRLDWFFSNISRQRQESWSRCLLRDKFLEGTLSYVLMEVLHKELRTSPRK